jgi:hypothetical protein
MKNNPETRLGFSELSVGELFAAVTIGDPRCEDHIKESTSLVRRWAEQIGKVVVYTGGMLVGAGIVTLTSLGIAYAIAEGAKFAYETFSELPRSSQHGLIITGALLTVSAYALRRLPRI